MTKKERLDRLAELVKRIPPERMAKALIKSERIMIRVSLADKEGIERMAAACGLTVTDYLTRLHYLAEKGLVKLSTASKRASRSHGTQEGKGKGRGKA